MPLHVPHLFHRSHSHTAASRTDLSTTYASPSQRLAQGYFTRSDWEYDLGLLINTLNCSLRSPDTDWASWSVESECRALRKYHFEHLDRKDQEKSVGVWAAIVELESRLRSKVINESQLVPIKRFIEQLGSFKEQALQLYGETRYGRREWVDEILEHDVTRVD